MKKNIKHRTIAMILAAIMMAAPVGGSVFAADEAAFDQPEKPVATSYKDNDKIEEYNKKVDEYNKSAEKYNESVDREYEAAVEETVKKNAEIDQHNEEEIQRVKTAEENNEKALKDAEEANAKIDEENASEEARVNEHNRNEEEKVRASEAAKAAAEEENESIAAHNEAVAKYEADKAQYDADLEQYQKDLAMEQKILAAGYESVEQYNDRINKAYNEPAQKSVTMNASTEIKSTSETYRVTEAAEKSGVNVSVSVKHVFEGTDVSYSEAFTIDANDTIVLNSIAALGSATNPGYASFYYKTDEDHSMGYWCESYSQLETTARHCEYGWNCGDEHEITYSEGKSHANDEEVIEMTYYYFWIPLRTYKTYNTPVAPTEITNPGEAREMVAVPEVYTANYQQFVKKEHVEAELEEIAEADIWENITAPIKQAYMEMMEYMALFAVPEAVIPAETAETVTEPEYIAEETAQEEAAEAEVIISPELIAAEAAQEKATATVIRPERTAAGTSQKEAAEIQTAEIADQEVAMAELAEAASPAMIADNKTPLAEQPAWALINLILTILTGLVSALLLAGYFGKKNRNDEEGSEEETEVRRKGGMRLTSIIPAAVSIIAFILTENMSNPMVLADRWTIFMAAILMIQMMAAIMAKKETEEAADTEAMNA